MHYQHCFCAKNIAASMDIPQESIIFEMFAATMMGSKQFKTK
jgi:hypothetical protein